jgi:hypothetical protein
LINVKKDVAKVVSVTRSDRGLVLTQRGTQKDGVNTSKFAGEKLATCTDQTFIPRGKRYGVLWVLSKRMINEIRNRDKEEGHKRRRSYDQGDQR